MEDDVSYRAMKLGVVLTLCCLSSSVFASTLTHQYLLTQPSGYNDTLGGPALNPLGGSLSGAGYTFGPGQGLDLSNAVLSDPANYTIDMVFSLDSVSGYYNGWANILNPNNLAHDIGIYSLMGQLWAYPDASSAGQVLFDGQTADLLLTRDGTTGEMTAYVDGVLVMDFVDSSGNEIYTGDINFFQDDFECCGNQQEVSGGVLQSVSIYTGPSTAVPEPASLLLLCGGLGMLGVASWPRKK
jgi:hypothetical protein